MKRCRRPVTFRLLGIDLIAAADPGELYEELERQFTGKPAELHELSPQLPKIKQEYEQHEEAPYVDVMDKLMLQFSKIGIWAFHGAESSPGVVKIQQS